MVMVCLGPGMSAIVFAALRAAVQVIRDHPVLRGTCARGLPSMVPPVVKGASHG
jgi:hypothetical protein